LNGASVGGVLFAPLWVTLIAAIGFAPAVAAVGLVMLAVLLPLTWRYLRPTPGSLGVAADGDPPRSPGRAAGLAQHRPVRFAALLANGHFATLAIAFALGMFAQVGVVAHLITRLAPLVGAADAAMAISLATGSAVAGRLLLGLLPGCTDWRLIAAANFTMQACGVALLACGATTLVLAPGCILFGLGIGCLLSLPPLIAQTEFAARDVPRVVALVTAVNQAVFAFAPAVFGILREVSGAYTLPFLLAAAVQVIAGAVIVLRRHGLGTGQPAQGWDMHRSTAANESE
jgi:hypothetical protein